MKLLYDQNISHRVCAQLTDLFPGSEHVGSVGLARASDDEIWGYAKAHGFVIVTHDADFVERSLVLGAPPKVVWLRCGNVAASAVEQLLRRNGPLLEALFGDPTRNFVELR